ncbi:MAG TPA: AraC family transcriptional regulator [Puia sp.]|nr:AraC family transcriptional regulator [Puia sp.]
MKNSLIREITPLTQSDCFTLFSRVKSSFNFPLHYHEEFELNFIQDAGGAQRVVGDHIEEINDLELVLIGPNLQHAWFTHRLKNQEIQEVTIQFHKDLFDEKFLKKNQLNFIRTMLEKSSRGILFSKITIEQLAPRICGLNKKNGFDSVLELMSILHDLSTSRNMRLLSDTGFNTTEENNYSSRRIEKTFEFMNQNFDRPVSLAEVARVANMSDVSFSRFFRQRTGNTFIESLNEIRLGHASRILIETTQNISEIAYDCGFNNISNFNRIFKKKKGCTPKEFRESFSGTRIFV